MLVSYQGFLLSDECPQEPEKKDNLKVQSGLELEFWQKNLTFFFQNSLAYI